MPFYDYICPFCQHLELDVYRSLFEHDFPIECPICSKPSRECSKPEQERHVSMKQLYSSPASLEFKGNGFYETDYRKKTMKKDDAKT